MLRGGDWQAEPENWRVQFMRNTRFYERYWQREGGSPAERGFAVTERKIMLRNALADLPAEARILDAGCGNGEFSVFLAQLGYKVTGVDLSWTALNRGLAAWPNGRFAVASIEAGMPFADGSFEAAWCTEVLEHLFDVHAALAEFGRILIPNGFLVITVPYHGLVKNVVIALAGFERHYDPYVSHLRFFTRKSLNVCLLRAGFSMVAWSGVGRRWPVWMSQFVVARKTSLPEPMPQIIG
jgi:2-polyprenyl-6-hydroxyphenyl methylase/3-demethylubiquinone-9 3-methyltransferase